MTRLDQSQRDQLCALVERRLSRLDDDVLLHLEGLTRYPERLQRFAPVAVEVEQVIPSGGISSPNASGRNGIGRRELLTRALSLAALGLVGGGSYIAGSQIAQETNQEYENLNNVVQTALNQLDVRVAEFAGEAQRVANNAGVIRETAVSYQNAYSEVYVAFDRWWLKTMQIIQYQNDMELVEGSVSWLVEFLSILASIPEFSLKGVSTLLGIDFDVKLGNTKNIQAALKAASELIKHLDYALDEADILHQKLSRWFSGLPESDIKLQLLDKLINEFYSEVSGLGEQGVELYQAWQQQFVQPVHNTQMAVNGM